MTEGRYRLMKCLSQIAETFCVAHSVAAIMLALIVDVEPHYVRVLLLMLYCLVMAVFLGVSHCLIDERIEEELSYEEYE